MSHKLSKIAVGVSAVLASASALALAPNTAIDINAYVGGATAQDGNFAEILETSGICKAGTLDEYQYIAPSYDAGQINRMFTCEVESDNVPGITADDPNVAFHKWSVGGSGYGVYPVGSPTVAASELQWLDPSNIGGCTVAGANLYDCDISLATVGTTLGAPDAGLSDVEPGLFVGSNRPSGFAAASTDFSNLTILSTSQVIIAPIVSTNFRNALQEIQGLTVGSEDADDMPSLSTDQLTAIFTGKVTSTWNNMLDDAGVGFVTAAGAEAPANVKPKICVRVNGSGTNATFRANVNRQECDAGAVPTLFSDTPPGFPLYDVVTNSGSGNMDACVRDADAAGQWAIGYNSTERNSAEAGYDKGAYRFIRVDGIIPRAENVNRAQYWIVGEASFQYRNPAVPDNDEFQEPENTTDLVALYEGIAAALGNPDFLSNPQHSWGPAGNLALTTNNYSTSGPDLGGYTLDNPVTPFTKSRSNGATDNCLGYRLDTGEKFQTGIVDSNYVIVP